MNWKRLVGLRFKRLGLRDGSEALFIRNRWQEYITAEGETTLNPEKAVHFPWKGNGVVAKAEALVFTVDAFGIVPCGAEEDFVASILRLEQPGEDFLLRQAIFWNGYVRKEGDLTDIEDEAVTFFDTDGPQAVWERHILPFVEKHGYVVVGLEDYGINRYAQLVLSDGIF